MCFFFSPLFAIADYTFVDCVCFGSKGVCGAAEIIMNEVVAHTQCVHYLEKKREFIRSIVDELFCPYNNKNIQRLYYYAFV